jgi:uncharacterized coiled-coil protein SlyX
MDTLQQQITELNHKMDRLYEIVERLSERITNLILEGQQSSENASTQYPQKSSLNSSTYQNNGRFYAMAEHKDILLDDGEGRNRLNPDSEQTLSSDIQIRRLTAQLTASYNRIAALEEQLLAHRIHS